MLSIIKECQCPKFILMTNILDLLNVAFWLKETLTKCTMYSGNFSSSIITGRNEINNLLSTSSSKLHMDRKKNYKRNGSGYTEQISNVIIEVTVSWPSQHDIKHYFSI